MTESNVTQFALLEVGPVEAAPANGTTQETVENAKKRANELDGKTWTRNSISIWSDLRKTPEEVALKHPAMFPQALAARVIESFTNHRDRTVLDPFAGVGSTVVAARRLGKSGVGIELSPVFYEIARQRCAQKTLLDNETGRAAIHHADARQVLDYVAEGSVDLVVTSPPYWDILNEKRSADYKETRHYGNYDNDLGAINDYGEFLLQLQAIFAQVWLALRPGAYCCVVVMDLRKKDKFYPYHSDVAAFMQKLGFIYDDLIIWDRRHEYNNMRPLGYPSVFRINKAHEYILIFQKPKQS
jgi:DNA modification methylase